MLSRIFMFPLLIAAIALLYVSWEYDPSYAVWIVVPVVLAAAIFALAPQIDWWWYKRRPPKLDAGLRRFLETTFSFYKTLGPEEQERFRQRVALFMIAKDFKPIGLEGLPEDVKCLVAANAVALTFGRNEYLLDRYENIIFYPHPFPSPQFPTIHASEIFHEDGVLIFSIEQLMAAHLRPDRYYNIGMHECVQAFRAMYPQAPYPDLKGDDWPKLEAVSGFTRAKVEEFIGLPQGDIVTVAITAYMMRPDRFKEQWPELARAMDALLQEG